MPNTTLNHEPEKNIFIDQEAEKIGVSKEFVRDIVLKNYYIKELKGKVYEGPLSKEFSDMIEALIASWEITGLEKEVSDAALEAIVAAEKFRDAYLALGSGDRDKVDPAMKKIFSDIAVDFNLLGGRTIEEWEEIGNLSKSALPKQDKVVSDFRFFVKVLEDEGSAFYYYEDLCDLQDVYKSVLSDPGNIFNKHPDGKYLKKELDEMFGKLSKDRTYSGIVESGGGILLGLAQSTLSSCRSIYNSGKDIKELQQTKALDGLERIVYSMDAFCGKMREGFKKYKAENYIGPIAEKINQIPKDFTFDPERINYIMGLPKNNKERVDYENNRDKFFSIIDDMKELNKNRNDPRIKDAIARQEIIKNKIESYEYEVNSAFNRDKEKQEVLDDRKKRSEELSIELLHDPQNGGLTPELKEKLGQEADRIREQKRLVEEQKRIAEEKRKEEERQKKEEEERKKEEERKRKENEDRIAKIEAEQKRRDFEERWEYADFKTRFEMDKDRAEREWNRLALSEQMGLDPERVYEGYIKDKKNIKDIPQYAQEGYWNYITNLEDGSKKENAIYHADSDTYWKMWLALENAEEKKAKFPNQFAEIYNEPDFTTMMNRDKLVAMYYFDEQPWERQKVIYTEEAWNRFKQLPVNEQLAKDKDWAYVAFKSHTWKELAVIGEDKRQEYFDTLTADEKKAFYKEEYDRKWEEFSTDFAARQKLDPERAAEIFDTATYEEKKQISAQMSDEWYNSLSEAQKAWVDPEGTVELEKANMELLQELAESIGELSAMWDAMASHTILFNSSEFSAMDKSLHAYTKAVDNLLSGKTMDGKKKASDPTRLSVEDLKKLNVLESDMKKKAIAYEETKSRQKGGDIDAHSSKQGVDRRLMAEKIVKFSSVNLVKNAAGILSMQKKINPEKEERRAVKLSDIKKAQAPMGRDKLDMAKNSREERIRKKNDELASGRKVGK